MSVEDIMDYVIKTPGNTNPSVVKSMVESEIRTYTDGKVNVTSWNDLTDKPFFEEAQIVNEPLQLTWDGNTDGLVTATLDGTIFYKVSDLILAEEQFKSATVLMSDGFELTMGDNWESLVEEGMITEDFYSGGDAVFNVKKDGVSIYDGYFAESGIYFMKMDDSVYTCSLITAEPVEHTKTVVKKIDEKFLPERTHYESASLVNEPLNLTWDGNTDGLVVAEQVVAPQIAPGPTGYLCKVSDVVLTDERFKSARIIYHAVNSEDQDGYYEPIENWEDLIDLELITEDAISYYNKLVIARKDNIEFCGYFFPEAGIYLNSNVNGWYISELITTEPVEHIKTIVHKLDKKYLPEHTHSWEDIENKPDLTPEGLGAQPAGEYLLEKDYVAPVQSDWEVLDPMSPAYVNNRPLGIVSTTDADNIIFDGYVNARGTVQIEYPTLKLSQIPISGETYSVYVDDVLKGSAIYKGGTTALGVGVYLTFNDLPDGKCYMSVYNEWPTPASRKIEIVGKGVSSIQRIPLYLMQESVLYLRTGRTGSSDNVHFKVGINTDGVITATDTTNNKVHTMAKITDIPTDAHINELIQAALAAAGVTTA